MSRLRLRGIQTKQWAAGKKQRARKFHVFQLCGHAGIKIIGTLHSCGTSCISTPFKNKNTYLPWRTRTWQIRPVKEQRRLRKNKDFYDLNSSHFTSSKDGDVDRAIENRNAREKATATEQKVDLQCTCKSLLLRLY